MIRISVLPIRLNNTAVYLKIKSWYPEQIQHYLLCLFLYILLPYFHQQHWLVHHRDIFRFAISYVCILSLLMILGIRFSLSWFSSVCDSWLISLPVMSMYRQAFEWPRLLWISSIIRTKHKQWSTGFPGDFKIPCSISSSVTEKNTVIIKVIYKRLSYFLQSIGIINYSTVQLYTKLYVNQIYLT